ncbi:MAG: DUF177 domain-containing protein [Kiritimatiellae bacterium]|nr:DUF177 domain-containing protein [Kiritimatiellia bacterium]
MQALGRLIVDVARLDKGGEWYRGETAPDLLELGESEFIIPVRGMLYELRIEVVGDQLLVRGAVRQSLQCVCSRCAEVFETQVEDADFCCAIEINEQTEFVDLTAEVREAIILALPGYPVCDEVCRGLCMACGVNLNKGACECVRTGKDGRWSALDALKPDGVLEDR